MAITFMGTESQVCDPSFDQTVAELARGCDSHIKYKNGFLCEENSRRKVFYVGHESRKWTVRGRKGLMGQEWGIREIKDCV